MTQNGNPTTGINEAAAHAARAAYGKLLAWLARQWRDIAAAEDALADAFATALVKWPQDGIPANAEAWLLTVAKRNMLHEARRIRMVTDPRAAILLPTEDDAAPMQPDIADDRLRLLLVCAHPAIDPQLRPALMLQTVLGIDAVRIAGAFLVSGEAMTKRLTRAKAKIREAGIRFEVPEERELAPRIASVLEAIYAAYTLDWDCAGEGLPSQLGDEAVFLARLVADLIPYDPETLGLAALLELCEARKPAQRDASGKLVALNEQDVSLWRQDLIKLATERLRRASTHRVAGPFQIEAAIQLAHCSRSASGVTPWDDICALYANLNRHFPTIGSGIGHAIALAHAQGDCRAALKLLEDMDRKAVGFHQPWWAAKAHILILAGENIPAAECLDRALQLSKSDPIRRFLIEKQRALRGPLN